MNAREAASPEPDGPEEELRLLRAELERVRHASTEIRRDLNETQARLERDERAVKRLEQELRAQAEEHHRAYEKLRGERPAEAEHDRDALEAENQALRERAERFEREFTRLRQRRLVRAALGIAGLAQPLFKGVRALRGGGPAPAGVGASVPPVEERADPETRARAEKRAFEALLEGNLDRPTDETSARERIAEETGDLILLKHDDVEPVTKAWLERMVETMERTGAAAVGARLVRRPQVADGDEVVGATLDHAGIGFGHGSDSPLALVPIGEGGDPLAVEAERVREVPAVSGACLLVRRSALVGVVEGTVSLQEDEWAAVDLCLALRERGHEVVYDGRAVLWHDRTCESDAEGDDGRHPGVGVVVANRGPSLFREVFTDRVRARREWSDEPLRVAVVGGEAPDFEDLGWETNPVPSGDTDVVVVLRSDVDFRDLPRSAVGVGIVGDGEDAGWLEAGWLDDLDVVLADSPRTAKRIRERSSKVAVPLVEGLDLASNLRRALLDWSDATRVGLLISTPDWDVADVWGDTHYARALQRWLERAGHPTRVVLRPDFGANWAAWPDMAIHLLGLSEHDPRPGQVSVLWNISHPEMVTPEVVDRYDLAFVASRQFADTLDAKVGTRVAHLPQATDADRFTPTPRGPHHDILFVANSRRERRRIVDDLTPTDLDLSIYGGDWYPELVDPKHVEGEVVPNRELPAWYGAATIVLNDHWPEMLEHGFISNRLYDALASGGFVISDHVEGIEEEFDDGVVTYTDRTDLQEKVARFLADPDARRAYIEKGRRAVLSRHTFAHRVATILDEAAPLLRERGRHDVAAGTGKSRGQIA